MMLNGQVMYMWVLMQVLIPAPFWVSYPEMARLAGAVPRIIDCSAEEGYLMTADQLRAALTPSSRLLILCTPSNPTGSVYPLQRLQVGLSALASPSISWPAGLTGPVVWTCTI